MDQKAALAVLYGMICRRFPIRPSADLCRRAATAALLLFILLLWAPFSPTSAQSLAPDAPAAEEAPAPADPYGRGTPEGTVGGFVDAIAAADHARASLYLNLENIPKARRETRGKELAEQLQSLLDRGGTFLPRTAISSKPEGHLDDGLEPLIERVGTIRSGDEKVDILLESVPSEIGPIWLISRETLKAVPGLFAKGEEQTTTLERVLPKPFLEETAFGAPIGHWLALFALAVVCYFASWLLIALILRIDTWWYRFRHREARSVFAAIAQPLRLWLAAIAVTVIAPRLGLSIVARELFARAVEVVAWFALAWLAWRVIDAVGGVIIRRLQGHGSGQFAQLATFLRRLVKGLVIIVGILAIFDTLGYDMTAGIAALGVGGLALALGAQKLIENLVASITILADQPVRVGEFCKVGDTMGTVEELGIRSTRIRTLDQTLVVIPNSDFAAKPIENYSRRGQFWFHPTLNLHQDTPPDQLNTLLERLREMLAADDRFLGPPRVRLLGVGNDRLPIEVFGYVRTTENDEFLLVQEEVTLRMLALVSEMGLSLAPPTSATTALFLPAGSSVASPPQPGAVQPGTIQQGAVQQGAVQPGLQTGTPQPGTTPNASGNQS